MNVLASKAPIGSAGISILPFGNGAERMLTNKEIGCSIRGLDFNAHGKHHIIRAAQEGIVSVSYTHLDVYKRQTLLRIYSAACSSAFPPISPIRTIASVSGSF